MKKSILVLAFLCLGQTVSFANWEDINNHWAYNEIVRFKNNQYVNGYQDNTFKPDNNIKYNEFIKILVTVIEEYIPDNEKHWDKPYIEYAKQIDLISNNIENYNEYIERGEVIDILYNFLIYYDVIDDMTLSKVDFFVKNNMLFGYSDNSLKLDNNITRSEAIVLIARTIDFKDKKIYSKENTLEIFENDNISDFTNYIGDNKEFLNTYSIKNNKIYYSDLGRYGVYNNITVNKYNDVVIDVLLELLSKDIYVLNTYIDINKCIIIAYGLKDKFVSNGSTLFEIYLFEENQKDKEFEYRIKITVNRLWKELNEIRNGVLYNQYYVSKLNKTLLHFLPNKDVEDIENLIKENISYFKSDNYILQRIGQSINIFIIN